ncbi:MAG TPA: 4a-hydroxytetrahydrobiopterin dehydratase [Vicinamibacteria bacterium]|nr:4a-hydroxytetrahydrobiopterin dehydratase [Vicinamibacteria bacterium]
MRLSDDEVRTRLAALGGWSLQDGRLRRRYALPSFAEALAFVNRVGALAEAADHHPDILVEYRHVTLTLSTHDAGGLTAKDFALAAQIDA